MMGSWGNYWNERGAGCFSVFYEMNILFLTNLEDLHKFLMQRCTIPHKQFVATDFKK